MKQYDTEILSVGTELLLGHITNTDARDISELLSKIGVNVRWHTVVGDNPERLASCVEIAKEIVRCGGLDGRVHIALDYFDASINRISAWTVGFRNVQKALLSALLTPADALKTLQDDGDFTELMVRQEELKTLPFGEVWNEYCARCGVPADGAWFDEIKKYEKTVLEARA